MDSQHLAFTVSDTLYFTYRISFLAHFAIIFRGPRL
uniref:Uncharacterized protein n=1 Tax=Triticum urartu TaxID=4572 RepID=A0A8R7TP90_TRIUA